MKSKAFVQTGLEEEYLRGMGMLGQKAVPSVARTPLVGAGGGWRADSTAGIGMPVYTETWG